MPTEWLLDVQMAPYWLATVDLDESQKPEARAWLAAFQDECDRVAAQHGFNLKEYDIMKGGHKDGARIAVLLYHHVQTTWPGGVKGMLEDCMGGQRIKLYRLDGRERD